jgi:hypothetical protein
LEVPPMPEEGITDEELFTRLAVFYNDAQVAEIVREMDEAGSVRERGEFELPPVDEMGQPLSPAEEAAMAMANAERRRDEIRSRYTRRMHDLSEFMKALVGTLYQMVQSHAFAFRPLVGRSFQERDRGKRCGGADDRGLHRS